MIIADSGFWIALIDDRDAHHSRAMTCYRSCREPLITTLPVVTEVTHLLLKRCGPRQALAFVRSHATQAYALFNFDAKHMLRVTELMTRYADLPMDFADASLVLLAEELGHGRILSTDQRDFHTYRWKNHEPFQNLLISK